MPYPDVVVIGGGIVGCACAYYLSQEGLRVHVVEKGALLSGASGAGEGGLTVPERPGIQAELAKASLLLWETLVCELPLDIEYRRNGTLYVAETEADLKEAAEAYKQARASGGRCQMLTPEDAVRLEPNLARDIAGGVLFCDGGQINPHLATIAMAQAAKQKGALIQTFTAVTGIEVARSSGAVLAVHTTAGRFPAGMVVNAAGAWSDCVGRMVGLDIPVVPRKGCVVVTEAVAPVINCSTVSEMGYVRAALCGDQGLFVALEMQQRCSGNLTMGMSRQFSGFDCFVEPKVIEAIVSRNLRFFPINRHVKAIRAYAGLRPYSPDNLPIICDVQAAPGFYVATGHEGEGQGLAPITGKLITQMIVGEEPVVDVSALALSRFAGAA